MAETMDTGVRPSEGVRTQNLRDFTVQIRRVSDNAIIGTGIAVSTDGKIVTCAHVVRAAGVEPRNADAKEIGVYFPQALGGEKKDRQAKVVAFFPDHDDDVVLLQLMDGLVPLGPERMPTLGTARESQANPFRSYGYRSLEKYIAGWAHGKIHGHVEPPDGQNLQEEPVQLESNQINQGMSGAPVLDIERNLVVGIVSETWFPYSDGKDSDTAWAVDTRVLSLAPLGLTIQDAHLPLKPAPQPKFDTQQAQAAVFLKEKYHLINAPAVLPEWTGRDHLLTQLTTDWNDPHKHVTGLIGFGGEGKSSLARKWVEEVMSFQVRVSTPPTSDQLELPTQTPSGVLPAGVFWWGFYENRSVDEFLEAALNYLSGGRIDPRQVPSSSLRAQIIGAMLGSGRYLFVLDGLEVMQYQDGDQYGLFTSNDLRNLLTYFARPDHESFCLVTSRAPLLDLMDYTTYTHRDVDRLSADDGRALLKRLGVQGDDTQLDKIVTDWDGHALTLSLLGSYLSEHFDGDIAHLADIPAPLAEEQRYERVHRVLRRYDEHLTAEEREFLKLFSAFRTPVHESAFEKVFVPLLQKDNPAVGALHVSSQSELPPLPDMVDHLVSYRLLRHDTTTQTYTVHPLVRNHYLAFLILDTSTPHTHLKIKDYYLEIGGETPQNSTLEELKPFIEAIHHLCRAGEYDDASQVIQKKLHQNGFVIGHQLGAFETYLALLMEFFFKNGEIQTLQLITSRNKGFVLNEIGLCLMSLGRLREAVLMYEQAVKIVIEAKDWFNASITYKNIASLYAHIGRLDNSLYTITQAYEFLKYTNKQDEVISLSWEAWINHLMGNLQASTKIFAKAEKLERHVDITTPYLYSLRGIQHADHLRLVGAPDYARRVTLENLKDRENRRLVNQLSNCHRVLGDLDADTGNHASAHTHYETALKIARGISRRDVLIEALLARGRWAAKLATKDLTGWRSATAQNLSGLTLDQAFNDLNEALGYCVESGYWIYEADVRVGLGWYWLGEATLTPSRSSATPPSPSEGRGEYIGKAKAEAERVLQMSEAMGYHWGQVDAREVLEEIGKFGE